MAQTSWQDQPFQARPKSNKKPVSFVEALKNIGGGTVKSLKDEVIKGSLTQAADSFFGQQRLNYPMPGEASPWSREWLPPTEPDWSQEMRRRERHKEVTQNVNIFDRQEEEIKKAIAALQDQLKALAKDMANLSAQTVKAIDEEVVHPGTYHLNFFEKLRKFIILLRKQVAESRNWLEMSYARKRAQNSFWSGFTKSGTKFSLSAERYSNAVG